MQLSITYQQPNDPLHMLQCYIVTMLHCNKMTNKQYGKVVRLSWNTINKLAEKRIAFESYDDCINRLISPTPQITVTEIPEEKHKKKVQVIRI